MQIVNAATEHKTERFTLHLFGGCVWLTKDITRAVCCYSPSCQCPIYLNTKTSRIFEYTALPHNNKTRKDPTLSPTRQFTLDSIINQSFRVHARRHPANTWLCHRRTPIDVNINSWPAVILLFDALFSVLVLAWVKHIGL